MYDVYRKDLICCFKFYVLCFVLVAQTQNIKLKTINLDFE